MGDDDGNEGDGRWRRGEEGEDMKQSYLKCVKYFT